MREHQRRLWSAALVIPTILATLAITAVSTAPAPPAQAATQYGNDISWPQCDDASNNYGLSTDTDFVVIGLTNGLPFTLNPCLQGQVSWASSHAVPAYAYTMAAYPSNTELNTHGASGPWATTTLNGRLANVGYAEATYAVARLAAIGWRPSMVWVDVEDRTAKGRPWAAGTAMSIISNRWVVLGLLRGLDAAGYSYGLYASAGPWQTIMGAWRLPTIPTWVTAGPRGSSAALAMCTATSFSGGTPMLAQWWDPVPVIDYDLTCPAFTATPPRVPAPSVSGSDLTGDWNNDLLARRASDGTLFMYRGNGRSGWLTPLSQGGGWGAFNVIDTPGEFNRSGYPDVLVRATTTGTVYLYPRLASAFGTRSVIATGWGSLTNVTGVGDFSGDGWPDVVAVDPATGYLYLYPRSMEGTWLTRVRIATGFNGLNALLGQADLDGNGMLDLLARESATGYLWLYPRSLAGTIGTRVRVGTGWTNMSSLAIVGDLNSDTTPDVLAIERATGYLWMYPRSVNGWLTRVRVGTSWNSMNLLG